jgi:hypothetical protein
VDVLFEPLVSHSVVSIGDYLIVAGGVNDSGNKTSLVEIFHDPTLIHIPDDYPTIQEGMNAASDGDTVLVAENTYYENINFHGKAVLLASEFFMDGDTSHIPNTIIDGSQPEDPDLGSVVTFTSGEDTTSVLCGFTITGGTGILVTEAGNARFGGGVILAESGGKLLNNYIEYNIISNEHWTAGGGICAIGPVTPLPWVVLRNNRINYNKAISSDNEGDGGGIESYYNLIMIDNQISYNEVNGPFRGDGGGVRIRTDFGHVELNVRNNLITHNKAVSISDGTDLVLSGGLDIFWDASGIVSDNVISFNKIEVADDKWGYGTGVLVELQDIAAPDFVFENNFITDNDFTGKYCAGGGLCIYTSGGKFQNNVIQNNKATHGGGIALEYNTSNNQAIFINNTITGNEGTYGGGFYVLSANAVVINTIIWGNTAPTGASIYEEGSTLEVQYSDVEGDDLWPGEGNINAEPQFLSDGYHLDDPGMLLNAGISTVFINGEWYDCPPYDIDGDARPYANTQPEIGVDEVQIVSIGEPMSTNGLSIYVYPNPADQIVTISVNNGVVIKELSIYNQIGKKVYVGIPDNNTLDVSKFQPGVYIIEIRCGQQKFMEKLIIK